MTQLALIFAIAALTAGLTLSAADASLAPPQVDWLVDPLPFKARVRFEAARHELVLENGLTSRTLRLAPNAATVDFRNLVTGEQLLRATGPEAHVTIDGALYQLGGLEGQPVQNFLKPEWLDQLRENSYPGTYRFAEWKEEPLAARFPWKKRPEWLARDYPWPAPGKQVALRFLPPSQAKVKLDGRLLFEDAFGGQLDAAWKTHVSGKHARSSFSNEGKHGEIYTPPETAVYAERPWPAGAATVEVTVDAGDDTQSNAWGPGVALVAPDRVVSFVIRPNQGCYDINGQPQATKFNRAEPARLRVRLDGKTARCEASQDGKTFTAIATVDCPKAPTALRVGKVGQGGHGEDLPNAPADKLIRCHVSHVAVREAEPANQAPAPSRTDLPEIDVHYAIYDGIPLIEKWLTIRNTTGKSVRVNRTVVESLRIVESESAVEPNTIWEAPSLYVESDYTYCAMNGKGANQFTVRWLTDRSYHTQVNYNLETPCLLEVAPQFGPEVDLPAGAELTSIRAFELFRDGTDRERRGLAQRRMYRTIAPWTQENPVMVHLISDKPDAIRRIVDQAGEVGVEMIILSFGSGINLENADPKYQAMFKEVADYARSKGIVIGAYSLLASRGAATAADNCGGPGARVRFGVMPCLGSKWGQWYLAQLQSFFTNTGFGILEHDGSYPADTCARTNHPGHRDLGDSQWAQWTAITTFYKWCRANGIYLNVPDWYFLNGSNKSGMGYRETNWSLPRNEQEIIERQNVFDGTWEKTSSMGWMFVPLTQYHGGGAAATIEPLCEHLDHYEARLSNLFAAGVQACYRGPRIYDTEQTKALVKKWISFYKQHREALDADMVHLRRPDGRDWDGFVHVNTQGKERALAVFYDPLPEAIEREIRIPLHYAGLTDKARVSVEGAVPETVTLDRAEAVTLKVKIPARGWTWIVFTAPG
ncbi:MAG: hypothetical protein NTW87_33040 [Planctomycetota bacterium]|nr:hypothetical protein [Planctomycetota bacterium]